MGKKKAKDFLCPIPCCGSTSYTTNYNYSGCSDGGGKEPGIENYTCDGCSVIFNDPKKFSRHLEKNKDRESKKEKSASSVHARLGPPGGPSELY
jgi:hypothetical protein